MATPPVRVKSLFKKAQTLSNKVKTILINVSQQTEPVDLVVSAWPIVLVCES